MVNHVLADEFQMTVSVAPIKPQLTLRQRNSEVICVRVLELFHYPDLRIRSGSVVRIAADLLGIVVSVLRHLRTIVDEEPLGMNAG